MLFYADVRYMCENDEKSVSLSKRNYCTVYVGLIEPCKPVYLYLKKNFEKIL